MRINVTFHPSLRSSDHHLLLKALHANVFHVLVCFDHKHKLNVYLHEVNKWFTQFNNKSICFTYLLTGHKSQTEETDQCHHNPFFQSRGKALKMCSNDKKRGPCYHYYWWCCICIEINVVRTFFLFPVPLWVTGWNTIGRLQ